MTNELYGWICPRCGCVNAPTVQKCCSCSAFLQDNPKAPPDWAIEYAKEMNIDLGNRQLLNEDKQLCIKF